MYIIYQQGEKAWSEDNFLVLLFVDNWKCFQTNL